MDEKYLFLKFIYLYFLSLKLIKTTTLLKILIKIFSLNNIYIYGYLLKKKINLLNNDMNIFIIKN